MEKQRLRRADLSRRLSRNGPMSSPDGQIDLREFLRRLENRLKRCRLTAHAAAIRAGLSPSQIGTMRRQHELGQQHGVSIRTVAKLAAVLDTTPEWLLSGTGPEEAHQAGVQETPQPTPREAFRRTARGTPEQTPQETPRRSAPETPQQIPQETSRQTPRETPRRTHRHSAQPAGLRLAGSVAAGVWVEPASGNIGQELAVIPADPRYPAQYQSAFEVRDSSIDRLARPGDYLIVVDRLAAQLPIRTGDIVIVTRQKPDLQEVTARRFTAETTYGPHGCRLDFESSDPRYTEHKHVPDMRNDGPTISIGGVVASVWRPLVLTR